MNGEWPAANIALVISGLSLLLALSNFAWNVWSKFIYPKPKVRISIRLFVSVRELGIVASIEDPGVLPIEFAGNTLEYPACGLEINNFGPPFVIVNEVIGEGRHRFGRQPPRSRFSLYRHYPPAPGDNEEEKWIRYGCMERVKVEPGDSLNVFFPATPSMFSRLSMDRIGIVDGFGRVHYVPQREIKRVKAAVKKFVTDPVG